MKEWIPPTNPPEVEWIRLASFIDGEGSIGIRSRGNFVITVVLTNSDPRLIAWAKNTFKVGTVSVQDPNSRSKDSYNRKPTYVWEVQARAAQWLLEGCLPFFIIKMEQAQLCLEVRSTIRKSSYRLTTEILNYRADLKTRLSAEKKRTVTMEEINNG